VKGGPPPVPFAIVVWKSTVEDSANTAGDWPCGEGFELKVPEVFPLDDSGLSTTRRPLVVLCGHLCKYYFPICMADKAK